MIVVPEITRRVKQQSAQAQGLVAVFSPQDFRANFQRDSAFGNHASGIVQKVLHRGRRANYFNGSTNYLKVDSPSPKLAALQCPMTITAWVNTNGSAVGTVFSQYRDVTSHRLIKLFGWATTEFAYYCSLSDGRYQRFAYSSVPTLGQWHFLTVVMSGTLAAPSLRLGANLIEQSFTPGALSTTPDTTVPIVIGADSAGVGGAITDFYSGYTGEIRVYDQALSLGELAEIKYREERLYRGNQYIPVGGYRWWYGQSNRSMNC